MNTLGIITEYNPFHYGHLYHIEKSKEISKSETVICIMNGNFVQRGEPALADKWTRTKMALANGADLVIELPLVYGIRSAEFFAYGSIALMDKIGFIDNLVFGSEAGNILPLRETANLLSNEDKYFKSRLRKHLSTGLPFPKARENAIKEYLTLNPEKVKRDLDDLLQIIAEPNNILGIEYLKALKYLKSNIKPYTIQRTGNSYHSKTLENKIASATAIRDKIYLEGLEKVNNYMPKETYQYLKSEIKKEHIPINYDYLGMMLISSIRKLNTDQLKDFAEVDNGLENRIYNEAHKVGNIEQLINNIKTKAYTRTRIQRNLLHIFFNIKEADFKLIDKYGPQYIRVLGIKKDKEYLLSELNKKSSCKVVINPATYLKEINTASNDPLIKSLSFDILATDLYTLLYKNPTSRQGHKDFITPLIKY